MNDEMTPEQEKAMQKALIEVVTELPSFLKTAREFLATAMWFLEHEGEKRGFYEE